MPTIISHTAVPLAVGLGLGSAKVPRLVLAAGVFLSVLPDFDVLAFGLGIPYASEFGHRGFSHSLFTAILVASVAALLLNRFEQRFWAASGFLVFSMASHGVLDCFTTGGKGIALLWPFASTRYFAPIQVIRVAPISVKRFLSTRGFEVLASEFNWIWLLCIALCLAIFLWRTWLTHQQVSTKGPVA
jgi:inner membrane protein